MTAIGTKCKQIINGLACKAAGPICAFKAFRSGARVRKFSDFCYSPLFVYVLGIVTLGLNLLGIDELTFSVLLLAAAAVLAFCPDALPALAIGIFALTAQAHTKHDFSVWGYVALGVCGGIAGICALWHAFVNFSLRRLRDGRLTWGFVAFAVAMLLSGLFCPDYDGANFRRALLHIAYIAVTYFVIRLFVRPTRESVRYFALVGLMHGIAVTVQLSLVYLVDKAFIASGFSKDLLHLGWGVSNQIGEALFRSVPLCFYLACTEKKHNWFYFAVATLFMVAIVFTYARATLLFAVPIYMLCCVLCCLFGKHRRQMLISGFCLLIIAGVCIFLLRNDIRELMRFFIDAGMSDRGRYPLWNYGMEWFNRYPVFGAGYFSLTRGFAHIYYHNTWIQIAACNGTVGLAAFLFHRKQMAELFTQKPTVLRTLLGLVIAGVLLISLLDFFYFNRSSQLFINFILVTAEYDLNKHLPFAYRFRGKYRLLY